MEKYDRMLFDISRGLRLLLHYFGLEDRALSLPGTFVCDSSDEYPVTYFEGSYADCLFYQFLHPEAIIISEAEHEIRAEQYMISHGQLYDKEYREMIHENLLVDRELRRRQRVRRKRRKRSI